MVDDRVKLSLHSVPVDNVHGDRLILYLNGVAECWKYPQLTWPLSWMQEDGYCGRSKGIRNECAGDILDEALSEVEVACSFFIGGDFSWTNGASISATDYKWRISGGKDGLGADFVGKPASSVSGRALYLMKDCSNGFYKIGISKSPKLRESTLQAERPSIKMIGQWDGMSGMERELHQRFADQRLRGEWFQLEPAQVRWVCHYLTNAAKV